VELQAEHRSMTAQRRVWWKLLGLGALLLGVATWGLLAGVDWTRWTPQTLREELARWGTWAPLIYIIAYTVRALFLIPASVMTLTGGVLFGPWWGSLYTVVGATLCGVIEFGVARWLGREAIEQFLARRQLLLRIDQRVAAHGFVVVLLVRLVPNSPYEIQNISLGLSPVRFRAFLLATLVGIVPWTVAYSLLGETLTDFRNIWKVLLGLLVLVLLIWGPWLWRRRRPT